ncbi:MAG TPA: DUF3429 domain-containing protein [Rubrivivax sp.]|nr:DUF3429 domain-containing protein [Rubrivivax sp.]
MPSATAAPELLQPPSLPAAARRLGYAGAAPLVLGALLVWMVDADVRPYAALGLSAYAALIASFLGGLHWGLAMREVNLPPSAFAWAVLPTLVAWPAVLMPPRGGLVVLGALLVGCYLVDRRHYPAYGVAHWLTLRFRLSAVAALSCFIGAGGT